MEQMSMTVKRLKEYAHPTKGPHGAASSKENLDCWADRAKSNSKIAPRASDGEMKLPSTGKMDVRDTGMGPKVSRKVDARMAAKQNPNFVGESSYMRGIRRDA
jgi:hypothetical protein